LPLPHSSEAIRKTRKHRNAYTILGAAFAVVIFVSLSLPNTVVAFWPFSNALAANIHTEALLIHDSSINLLRAATNSNPDPIKGNASITMTGGSALIAQSGPEGTAADVNPAAANGQISLYVVRPGRFSFSNRTYVLVCLQILFFGQTTLEMQVLYVLAKHFYFCQFSGLQHIVKKR